MPRVGYSGHMPLKKGNATTCYGTSPFRRDPPATRQASAFEATNAAVDRRHRFGNQTLVDMSGDLSC